MNNQIKALLSAMAAATSTSPINVTGLQKASGIENLNDFDALCEQLYQSRQINRCLQTKAGVTQYLFWPTAIFNKHQRIKFVINPEKIARARAGIAIKRNEGDSMKNLGKKTDKKSGSKYTALLIVKTVQDHPNIKIDDLVSLLIGENEADYQKAKYMVYYCIKSNILSKDSAKQLILGANDAWLIKNGFFDEKVTPPSADYGAVNNFLNSPNQEDLAEINKPTPGPTNALLDDTTACINRLFELLPENCGFGLERLADGNMHIKVAIYEKTYTPKAHEVESCIKAIKTLTQFQAVN